MDDYDGRSKYVPYQSVNILLLTNAKAASSVIIITVDSDEHRNGRLAASPFLIRAEATIPGVRKHYTADYIN